MAYATATSPSARAMILLSHDGPLPRDHGERMALLRAALPEPAWKVPQILAAFDAAPGFYLDSMTQIDLPAWHAGRMGLIGDAAWCASPASGQGTTLAVLGGYATAMLLLEQPEDPSAAFERAHALLAPLVNRNQALGRGNIKRMVLPNAKSISSTLVGLRALRFLHLENAILGTVARQLAKASVLDLPAEAPALVDA